MTITSNQSGMSVFGAMVSIFILGMIGSAALYLSVISETGKQDNWVSSMSGYIAQAGAEYAMKKYYEGNATVSVIEPGKSFADGTFIISESGSSPNITVSVDGRFGTAIKKISFKKPDHAKCTVWDTATTALSPNTRIHQLYFKKVCLDQIIVDKITVSWNPTTGGPLNRIDFDAVTQFSGSKNSGELIEIVNYVVSNTNQRNTEIYFDTDMTGKTFTIQFTMEDTTLTSKTFGPY